MNQTPSQRLEEAWGSGLRRARKRAGMTQEAFAVAVGRDQTTISRYERGAGAWTPEAMLSFAVALDATVDSLFPWPTGIEDAERFRRLTAPQPIESVA